MAGLPPIPAGKTRVFRGQTADHPTIRAAAYRKRIARSAIWHVYSRNILEVVTGKAFGGQFGDEMILNLLWLEAVAQHYGAGSHYLDVTRSAESAAWFALHRATFVTEQSWLGPPGVPSIEDLPGESDWLHYVQSSEPGFLYAFDVDVWSGRDATIPDLTLVDLHLAPELFRTPRMLSQEGCLIRVGEAEQYDLRRHCVAGTPLGIARPLTGSAFVNRTVEEMFPPPSIDAWYRRFLRIPMTPEIDSTSRVVLRRPLPVTLYRGETQAYNDAIADTESFLYPPLLHRLLQQSGRIDAPPAEEWWKAFAIHDATPILLEAPLLHGLPAQDGFVNHELLISDIVEAVPWYSSGQDNAPGGETGLRSVLFQFSDLEQTFWERADAPGATATFIRGVWIIRGEREIAATLLIQEFPGTEIRSLTPGIIRLDPQRRRLMTKPAGSTAGWAALSELWALFKPVFVALQMLRAISPQLKPEASPKLTLGTTKDSGTEYQYGVAIIADAARLVRVADPAGLADWYVMRDQDGDPFTEARFGAGVLSLSSTEAFADLRPNAIYDAMLSALAAKQP